MALHRAGHNGAHAAMLRWEPALRSSVRPVTVQVETTRAMILCAPPVPVARLTAPIVRSAWDSQEPNVLPLPTVHQLQPALPALLPAAAFRVLPILLAAWANVAMVRAEHVL